MGQREERATLAAWAWRREAEGGLEAPAGWAAREKKKNGPAGLEERRGGLREKKKEKGIFHIYDLRDLRKIRKEFERDSKGI
jgi:hypothetical protein